MIKNKNYTLIVFPEKCHGCGICVVVCPVNAANDPHVAGGAGPVNEDKIVIRVENGVIKIVNPELCGGCGECVRYCPVDAIKLLVK